MRQIKTNRGKKPNKEMAAVEFRYRPIPRLQTPVSFPPFSQSKASNYVEKRSEKKNQGLRLNANNTFHTL